MQFSPLKRGAGVCKRKNVNLNTPLNPCLPARQALLIEGKLQLRE